MWECLDGASDGSVRKLFGENCTQRVVGLKRPAKRMKIQILRMREKTVGGRIE
jgi:hypothetical protein